MIGYYVHHHGHGHLQRACCIAAHLRQPLTILTSAQAVEARTLAGPVSWVALSRDDTAQTSRDPTAGGVLHWAPRHDPGVRRRMAHIAAWIDRAAPELMVVDVSVEVTALCRLMGVPVITVAMRGDRTDRAHQLGYDLAEMLLACWPASLPVQWPPWNDKIFYAGAFSRFDDRISTADHMRIDPTRTGRPRRVALLLGGGGTDITIDELRAARAATPHWRWEILGGPGHRWQADPWAALCAADVVITHAGQNALAEVAAARTPAVVIPQRRPHDEQFATAATLDKAELALVHHGWPPPSEWPTVLEKAAALDGRRWALWCPGDGAARAAQFIESTAVRMAQ